MCGSPTIVRRYLRLDVSAVHTPTQHQDYVPLTNSPCACACRTFGDRKALHDVWTDFAASPILTHFGWSPLVELAFDNDREVISPTTVFGPPLSAIPTHPTRRLRRALRAPREMLELLPRLQRAPAARPALGRRLGREHA